MVVDWVFAKLFRVSLSRRFLESLHGQFKPSYCSKGKEKLLIMSNAEKGNVASCDEHPVPPGWDSLVSPCQLQHSALQPSGTQSGSKEALIMYTISTFNPSKSGYWVYLSPPCIQLCLANGDCISASASLCKSQQVIG